MNVAVLGTASVGRALAAKLHALGHSVTLGTRDPQETLARTEPDEMGNPPLAQWHQANRGIEIGTFAKAAQGAALVVNATNGAGSIAALQQAGPLDGKIVLDVSNPLDFSNGMPPSLFVANTDSLAERIQAAFPRAKVVKSLNTVTASLMVDPKLLAGGDHSVFVSGDDADAKREVTTLLHSFGWRDVIDLGDITTARGAEMWLPLWLQLWGAMGSPLFNLKIIRK